MNIAYVPHPLSLRLFLILFSYVYLCLWSGLLFWLSNQNCVSFSHVPHVHCIPHLSLSSHDFIILLFCIPGPHYYVIFSVVLSLILLGPNILFCSQNHSTYKNKSSVCFVITLQVGEKIVVVTAQLILMMNYDNGFLISHLFGEMFPLDNIVCVLENNLQTSQRLYV
jgi:hypothetical protein